MATYNSGWHTELHRHPLRISQEDMLELKFCIRHPCYYPKAEVYTALCQTWPLLMDPALGPREQIKQLKAAERAIRECLPTTEGEVAPLRRGGSPNSHWMDLWLAVMSMLYLLELRVDH